MSTRTRPPATLAALARAIGELSTTADPIERAQRAAQLADAAKTLLAGARREAVYEASRRQPYAEVAQALHVTPAAINVTVTQHLKTLRAAAA